MVDSTPYSMLQVRTDYEGQVLRVVLSAPPGNVLERAMIDELRRCTVTEGASHDLKAIVLEGSGKHFCFGASVAEHEKSQAPAMIEAFGGLFRDLLDAATPLVALVRGQCLGGGMELATFCNFVVAEPSAKFGPPEINLAVFPPVAACILPDLIGQAHADDVILTGRSIDASTARAWGLVHAVADDGEAAVTELIEKHLLPKSASSLRIAVRAARRSWYQNLPNRMAETERLYLAELMETPDANEGIAAFLEKRTPKYVNR